MRITAGKKYTACFVVHRENHRSVCTRTRHGYGFGGYGCGVGKMYLRYTRAEPYDQIIYIIINRPFKLAKVLENENFMYKIREFWHFLGLVFAMHQHWPSPASTYDHRFIYSNIFIGRWNMMYSVHMQQCLLCRAQLHFRALQESQIHLITAFTHSNTFIGCWDMMYFVYMQQNLLRRAQSSFLVSSHLHPSMILAEWAITLHGMYQSALVFTSIFKSEEPVHSGLCAVHLGHNSRLSSMQQILLHIHKIHHIWKHYYSWANPPSSSSTSAIDTGYRGCGRVKDIY